MSPLGINVNNESNFNVPCLATTWNKMFKNYYIDVIKGRLETCTIYQICALRCLTIFSKCV